MPSVNCCIEGCGNNAFKAKQQGIILHFHRFPKDPYLRDQWMLRCVKDDSDNIDGARVCSDHFSIDDYDDIIKAKLNNTHPKVLKSTAIPLCNLPTIPSEEIDPPPAKISRSSFVSWQERYDKLLDEYKEIKSSFEIQEVYIKSLKDENSELQNEVGNLQVENELLTQVLSDIYPSEHINTILEKKRTENMIITGAVLKNELCEEK